MINSVHRFLLLIPNPNFLLYSCNSFIIVRFLRNFRYQFRIGNLSILTDNHYRTCQQTGKRSVGHAYPVVFIKIGETEIRQRNHILNTLRCTETCMCKGKSLEIANTTVSGRPAASLLNLRTEVAHTPVSRLGKIFKITFFPFSSFKENEDKSVLPIRNRGQQSPPL